MMCENQTTFARTFAKDFTNTVFRNSTSISANIHSREGIELGRREEGRLKPETALASSSLISSFSLSSHTQSLTQAPFSMISSSPVISSAKSDNAFAGCPHLPPFGSESHMGKERGRKEETRKGKSSLLRQNACGLRALAHTQSVRERERGSLR